MTHVRVKSLFIILKIISLFLPKSFVPISEIKLNIPMPAQLTCITRSMNDELYNMMLSLCPANWNFIKVKNSRADSYIDYLFSNDFGTKWILNLDEDCFLNDYNMIYSLIEHMETNDYAYCGVQDGGSIPVRIHNPLVSNPFFNLFNSEKIFPLEKTYFKTIYKVDDIKDKYSHLVKFLNTEYKYDLFEPFYNQFFWLLEQGLKPLFLEAKEFSQERYLVIAPLLRVVPYYNNPTMILNHIGEELALHTWHSRYYVYPNIRKRINNCYKYSANNPDHTDKKVTIVNLNR